MAPKNAFTYRSLGKHEGLGNQLFQLAGTIGIASAEGRGVLFPARWRYRKHYSLPADLFAGPLVIARCAEAWPRAESIDYVWRRYLQDIGIWENRRREIWQWFQPSTLAATTAQTAFAELLAAPDKTALHVRRGDYVSSKPFHRPCPVSYYTQAISETRAAHARTRFVVFSDDIAWCRANLELPDATFIDGNPDWLDMTLMSKCEHHICANSTFSWWGAFLSNDKSPILPVVSGTLPDFERLTPRGWRLIET